MTKLALLLRTALFVVLAVCATKVDARSQNQKVSLHFNAETLAKVFKEIRKQTKLIVFYSDVLVNDQEKITINVKEETLSAVMDKIVAGKPLRYEIQEKYILIKAKSEAAAFQPAGVLASNENGVQLPVTKDISGKITDENGNPLAGAGIKVKGTQQGTSANAEGVFVLKGVDENATIEISFVGYETMSLKVKDETSFVVSLKVKEESLQEVVVNKGYYNVKQRDNTGDVTVIKGSEIQKQPIGDPVLALQGRVPGLQMSLSSGIPGATVNIQLRGKNSLRFDANSPLFIVDGIPFPASTLTNSSSLSGPGTLSPFSSINMQDIENIEILKDADATAIYGSRGANGVILVTTKKGKAGRIKVTANVNDGSGKVSRMLDLLNTQQYLQIRHEALQNDGVPVQSTDYDINGKWDTTRYTDWQKIMIGNTAHTTNGQVSISGGTELTQYVVGGSYRKETTIFPGDYSDKKSSAFININSRSENRKFSAQISASYLADNSVLPTEDFTRYIFLAPDAPSIYNADGSLNWANNTWNNPFALLLRKSRSISTNLIGSLNLSYAILPGLEIKSAFGYNKIHMDQSLIFPLSSYSPLAAAVTSLRKNQFGSNDIGTWNVEPQISYNREIANGKFEALIGCTFQETINNSFAQNATNFLSDALIENIASAPNISTLNSAYSQYRYNAFFGRIGYNWKESYIINLTARRDGSTRFGPNNQFGNFGAVGVGWIFTNEKFIENNLKFLSFGKIRASFGTTGNDQLPPYQYLRTYSPYSPTYLGSTGLIPTRLTNPYFGWEMVKKLEFGLELGFLNNRILLYSNYYRNRTDNQLVGYSLPIITGFTSVQANLPAVIQNKGFEFELNTTNFNGKNFKWETSFNISFPRNKLISFPNIAASSYSTTYEVGKSLFASKRYHYTGIDPQTGLITYQDYNGDGLITSSQDRVNLKENTQKYFGGLNNSFSFKGITVSVFFQFVSQTGYIYLWNGPPGAPLANQRTIVLNSWRKPGDITNIPRLTQNFTSASSNFNSSDGQVNDASFIRLKNVSLSYDLPYKWLQKLHLREAKVYLNAQNLFTITKYEGLDPEVQSIINVAPVKMIVAGMQLSF